MLMIGIQSRLDSVILGGKWRMEGGIRAVRKFVRLAMENGKGFSFR